MNRLVHIGIAAAVLAAGVVWAAPAKNVTEAQAAEDARKAHFKEIGKTWEPIANMLRRKQPYDGAIVEKQSAQLVELSKKIPGLFEVDTHTFKEVKTEALDGIWTSQADFKAKAEELTRAMTALNEASKGGGDAATFPKSAASVGKACSGCHDNFRMKKTD
ncbi:MAG: cytochrome c [Pseudomonadota bacterium]